MNPPKQTWPGETALLILYGSHAHGTATETSDEDWRGAYQMPNVDFLGLSTPPRTYALDSSTGYSGQVLTKVPPDTVLWEIGHYTHLLLQGNPNIVGMLWVPDDCLFTASPWFDALREQRRAFISSAMGRAYLGWIETELRKPDKVLTPKRLSHLVRLTYELSGAMEDGDIPVRLEGAKLRHVRTVKAGDSDHTAERKWVEWMTEGWRERVLKLPDPPRNIAERILLDARGER